MLLRQLPLVPLLLALAAASCAPISRPLEIDPVPVAHEEAPSPSPPPSPAAAPPTAPPPARVSLVGRVDERVLADVTLEAVYAEVHLDGRLAHTDLELVVTNSGGTDSEGRYALLLPERAAITRLALDVHGEVVEGELEQQTRAARIYDRIVRRLEDPALLEWRGHGRFSLRVFPVPARGRRVVRLGWDEVLPVEDGALIYRLVTPESLAGYQDGLAYISLHLHTPPGASILTTKGLTQQPDGTWDALLDTARRVELRITPPTPVVTRCAGSGSERVVLIDAATEGSASTSAPSSERPLVLAIDTSASVTSKELERIAGLGDALLQTRRGPVEVVLGGQRTWRCVPTDRHLTPCLHGLAPRGASDLAGLVREALDLARAHGGADVILFSDGHATLGEQDADALSVALGSAEGAALFAVATGDLPDLEWLRALTEQGGGQVIEGRDLAPGALLAETIDALARPRSVQVEASIVAGRIEGLKALAPTRVAPGDRVAFAGRLLTSTAAVELVERDASGIRRQRVRVEGCEANPAAASLWGKARIQTLEREHAAPAAIVTASTEAGVLGRKTAWLVLENDAAFAAAGIRRRRVKPPTVRVGKAVVLGHLDASMIRRVIRQHTTSLRACYERSLQREPGLGGRLTVRFAVEVGSITDATIKASDIPDAELHECILANVRTWRFPMTAEMGRIQIVYPFQFTPDLPTATSTPEGSTPEEVDAWVATLPPLEVLEPGELRTGRQIEAMLREGRSEEATRAMAEALEALAQDGSPDGAQRRMRLFIAPTVRAAFPAEFRAAAIARLAHPFAPPGLFDTTVMSLAGAGDVSGLCSLVRSQAATEAASAPFLLERGLGPLGPKAAEQVRREWLQALRPADAFEVLSTRPALQDRYPEELFQAAAALINAGSVDAEVVRLATKTGLQLDRSEALGRMLRRACGGPAAPALACRRDLPHVRTEPGVPELLARLHHERLEELERERRARPGEPEVLDELAALLMTLGRRDDAVETITELVELHPWDAEARRGVFERLVSMGAWREACRFGADTVALDPQRFPWLRDLLALGEEASAVEREAIDACVFDTIARLGRGQGAVAVVLWENPLARVDIGVRLPDGSHWNAEEVSTRAWSLHRADGAPGPTVVAVDHGVRGEVAFSVMNLGREREDVVADALVIERPGQATERRHRTRVRIPASAASWVPIGLPALRL